MKQAKRLPAAMLATTLAPTALAAGGGTTTRVAAKPAPRL